MDDAVAVDKSPQVEDTFLFPAAGPGREPNLAEQLAERLAGEMADAWRRGTCPQAEAFLARHPDLAGNAEAALRLIYEEFCLREERGQEVSLEEALRRFPQWREELCAFFDCRRLLQPADACQTGEVLGDFRLLAELGRGGAGRVFLASQSALADRPVVLKVTPCAGQEHLSLARLQHTHIVPLYCVQDFPDRNLRALCMPYLGGTTLEQLLAGLRDRPPKFRTGQDLLGQLDQAQDAAPVQLPRRGPAREFLAQASYVQAVCWIGACLANALHYAHERGLVHLDLKPSNVLLAADGQPLILDFHLAHGPVRAGEPAAEWLGGTPGSMSPEQHAALSMAHLGQPVPTAVDHRSDIYSLGLILYDLLGKTGPAESPAPARTATTSLPASRQVSRLLHWLFRPAPALPRLESVNPQVSVGLADIVHKCLAQDPRDRYADADALAADLQRHRSHRPLEGVANRSLVERWRKWRRRRPHALAQGAMFLVVLATALLATIAMLADRGRRLHEAEVEARAALADGQAQMKKQQYAEALQTFLRGSAVAGTLPAGSELASALDDCLRLARRAEAAHHLHLVADRLRLLYGIDTLHAGRAHVLEARCRTTWQGRAWVTTGGAALEPAMEQRIRTDLLDLATLWADLRVRLAPAAEAARARREALRILAEAETVFGPSLVLCRERQAHAQALGLADEARSAEAHARELAPQTAWEYYALGRLCLRSADRVSPMAAASIVGLIGAQAGDRWLPPASALAAQNSACHLRAAAAFEQALELQPNFFWANFYQGLCAYRLGRHAEAAGAFHACAALAPDNAECFYNRALAQAALGHTDQALRDYERALTLAPNLAAAALNRGMLHYRAKRYLEAESDFQRALDNGADPAMVHYNLALLHLALEDRATAQQHLDHALEHNPRHPQARELDANLRCQP